MYICYPLALKRFLFKYKRELLRRRNLNKRGKTIVLMVASLAKSLETLHLLPRNGLHLHFPLRYLNYNADPDPKYENAF